MRRRRAGRSTSLLFVLLSACANPSSDGPEETADNPAGAAADKPKRDAGAGSSRAELDSGSSEPKHPDSGGAARDAAGDARRPSVDAATSTDTGSAPEDDAGSPTAGNSVQMLPPALRDTGVIALFPPPMGRDLCPDPPLWLTFSGAPTLGTSGKVQVFDTEKPGTAVATVDLASNSVTDMRGGVTFSMERPAHVVGNAAVFYLPSRALSAGRSYFVRLDKGAVRGPLGTPAIDDDTSWSFSTAKGSSSGDAKRKVALDGSGDFCSLQGALDSISTGTIEIGRGTYHGIAYAKGKRDLTIRGADRKQTILSGTNNERMNSGTAKRSLIGIDASSGITFENLTIQNLTPQDGTQAEALRLQTCDRCIVRDADILSLQDTLLWSGRIYAQNCYIAGNVDFIWGTGAAYFDHCEIKTLGRGGYNVQSRNGASSYGYVFVDSKLTSDPGVTGNWLGRIDASSYPASHVAYIDCEMGKHINPAGWQVTGVDSGQLRFWEYRSKDPSGAAIDVSKRIAASKQLTEQTAAQMRDPSVVLGGWSPPP